MAGTSKQGGQRGNLSSASGRKQRSQATTQPMGSRVEPSHVTEKAHSDRAKKAVQKGRAASKKNG